MTKPDMNSKSIKLILRKIADDDRPSPTSTIYLKDFTFSVWAESIIFHDDEGVLQAKAFEHILERDVFIPIEDICAITLN